MAGRPRTTLQKVRELRDAADALHDAIVNILPQQYVERGARGDALAEKWLQAEDQACWAFAALDNLADMIAAKVASTGNDAAARVAGLVESLSADVAGEEAVGPQATPSEPGSAEKHPET